MTSYTERVRIRVSVSEIERKEKVEFVRDQESSNSDGRTRKGSRRERAVFRELSLLWIDGMGEAVEDIQEDVEDGLSELRENIVGTDEGYQH